MARKGKFSVQSYILDARALEKQGFTSLKKYRRRKTLTPAEKAAISRARNKFLAGGKPSSKKRKKDAAYAELVKTLKSFDADYKKYARRKTFKPAERAAITRRARKISWLKSKNFVPLTKAQARRIPKAARADNKIPGIILRSAPGAKIKRVATDGTLYLEVNGRNWIYKPLPITRIIGSGDLYGEQQDALIDAFTDAAREAFDAGARQVHLWTAMGRSAEGYGDFAGFEKFIVGWIMKGGSPNEKLGDPLAQLEDYLVGIAYMI